MPFVKAALFLLSLSLSQASLEKPKYSRDEMGNAVIEIPSRFWQGKDFQTLKIHLSKEVLMNLTKKPGN